MVAKTMYLGALPMPPLSLLDAGSATGTHHHGSVPWLPSERCIGDVRSWFARSCLDVWKQVSNEDCTCLIPVGSNT